MQKEERYVEAAVTLSEWGYGTDLRTNITDVGRTQFFFNTAHLPE